ncbi:MAG: DUF1027 domain-containing protein [Firmicutes bacterium]|nr:DUF1027 domain-containing protein [Bacillota bacterium]
MKNKKYIFNDNNYELIKDYKDGFDKETVESLMTDYFDNYDYVVGDWSYGKLRLKGFCDKENKMNNKINNINSLDIYIKENCAYDCRYFVLKKSE